MSASSRLGASFSFLYLLLVNAPEYTRLFKVELNVAALAACNRCDRKAHGSPENQGLRIGRDFYFGLSVRTLALIAKVDISNPFGGSTLRAWFQVSYRLGAHILRLFPVVRSNYGFVLLVLLGLSNQSD
jgi:hypothetical protein